MAKNKKSSFVATKIPPVKVYGQHVSDHQSFCIRGPKFRKRETLPKPNRKQMQLIKTIFLPVDINCSLSSIPVSSEKIALSLQDFKSFTSGSSLLIIYYLN